MAVFVGFGFLFSVMAGLVPAIHVVPLRKCATQVSILRRIARSSHCDAFLDSSQGSTGQQWIRSGNPRRAVAA
jgi:hypothetical protein